MNCCKVFPIIIILLAIQLTCVEPRRDWIKWFKAFKLVKVELLSGRAVGVHKSVPTVFDVLTDGIQYVLSPGTALSPTTTATVDSDLIYGKGITLKGDPIKPITFQVDLPILPRNPNVCGLVITSLNPPGSELIFNLRAMWKSDININWDIVANPSNGAFEFNLRMRSNSNTRVVLFDSIPALHFMLLLTTIPGKDITFKMAFLQNCRYRDTIEITNCGEKIDMNPRFASLPFEVPISIKCPMDCIRTWPCWGYKIYSTDSPICWAATQNFGRWGNGYYTLYKIPQVVMFRSEINPILTHQVYCRQSVVQYSGFTFDRKYFDFAKSEYRDTMGA